ncbi:MAG: hypothetical protein ACLR43_02030 [Faecalibacillus faecis]
MVRGLASVNQQYYFNQSGPYKQDGSQMEHTIKIIVDIFKGWLQGPWYYLDQDGKMVTGLASVEINNIILTNQELCKQDESSRWNILLCK